MPKFETVRHVHHSPEQMFALVADVEKYPEFLPMCEALTVRSRREREGVTLLVADMSVGYKAISETFTSQVVLKPADNAIDVKYLDGPFRHMHSRWAFRDAGEGLCDVDFHVDFEFRNAILQKVIGVVFDEAMRRVVRAFEARAEALYGRPS